MALVVSSLPSSALTFRRNGRILQAALLHPWADETIKRSANRSARFRPFVSALFCVSAASLVSSFSLFACLPVTSWLKWGAAGAQQVGPSAGPPAPCLAEGRIDLCVCHSFGSFLSFLFSLFLLLHTCLACHSHTDTHRMPFAPIYRCTSVSYVTKTISVRTGWSTMPNSCGGATWRAAVHANSKSPLPPWLLWTLLLLRPPFLLLLAPQCTLQHDTALVRLAPLTLLPPPLLAPPPNLWSAANCRATRSAKSAIPLCRCRSANIPKSSKHIRAKQNPRLPSIWRPPIRSAQKLCKSPQQLPARWSCRAKWRQIWPVCLGYSPSDCRCCAVACALGLWTLFLVSHSLAWWTPSLHFTLLSACTTLTRHTPHPS